MIVSVHLPKTAGSSFKVLLERKFESRLLLDYGDLPINTPIEIRNQKALADAAFNVSQDFGEYECIHGHFLPAKYIPLKISGKAIFITWLRDPFKRMVSHYNFWKRTYNSASSPILHRKVIEENWTLEEFCFSDEMRNFYAQFLWSFPENNFEFIGITEHFETDLQFFFRHYLGIEIQNVPRVNEAPALVSPKATNLNFLDRFMDFHSEDYRIYQIAKNTRAQRNRGFIKND